MGPSIPHANSHSYKQSIERTKDYAPLEVSDIIGSTTDICFIYIYTEQLSALKIVIYLENNTAAKCESQGANVKTFIIVGHLCWKT